jgi:protein-arginine deiminase
MSYMPRGCGRFTVRKRNSLYVRDILLAWCTVGTIVAAACTSPSSWGDNAGQGRPQPNVLIPNIDDDNGDGIPDANVAPLPADRDDDILQIQVLPRRKLPQGTIVRTEVLEPWTHFGRAFVRTTSREGSRFVPPPVEVNPAETRKRGVIIGVEAADFPAPDRPPTIEVKITFETQEGRPLHEETLQCRVAPFQLSCCLDPAKEVQVVRTKETEPFVRHLESLVKAAAAELEIIDDAAIPEHDIWIQDAVEIGFATDGKRMMHVALHGNRGRELDTVFAKKMLGRNFGVLRKGDYRGTAAQWIDWYGNLEVSPLVKAKGRDFKNGRIYAGTQGERAMHPEVVKFLEAQDAQGPVLWLDTSWLVIGHVDETVSWVPSKAGTPFRMLIPSPRLAVEILRQAEQNSPGGILNRGTKREGDKSGEFERPVAEALKDKVLMEAQEFVQGKIDAVRRTLQEGLGVDDADVIEIPVLFNSDDKWFPGRYFAETANMVNGLLVGNVYIVPDPHGPLVDGQDVLLWAVKDRLEPLGCQVVTLDCFYPYHRWGGEIHCGTNATRLKNGT